jgi:hypothetical protein
MTRQNLPVMTSDLAAILSTIYCLLDESVLPAALQQAHFLIPMALV